MAGILRRREAPARRVLTQFARGALRLGERRATSRCCRRRCPNLATLLREAGYTVAYKGKWHLTHPSGGEGGAARRLGAAATPSAIERDYGFADWEAPDAGENAKAEHFGGGNAGEGEGWDEVYTRQAERWLGRADLPEPFCLVVSLVNPHDVLGYPASYERGGYSRDEFRDLGVELPPTLDEDLSRKPAVHSLMRMGMTAYMGPLRDREAQLDYVNFYAHLHRLVDDKIGRLVAALGERRRPGLAALAHRRRPLRRPRRDGALARRPAPEDLQRLRGDDQRPARLLQPGAVRRAGRDRARSPRSSTCCRRCSTLAGREPPRRSCAGRDLTPILAAAADRRGRRERLRASTSTPVLDHPAPAASVRTRSTSPTTTTRPAPRCRRRRASRTGSARSAPPRPSTPSTSTPAGASRPSTSSTTSSATRSRSRTWSTSARGSRARARRRAARRARRAPRRGDGGVRHGRRLSVGSALVVRPFFLALVLLVAVAQERGPRPRRRCRADRRRARSCRRRRAGWPRLAEARLAEALAVEPAMRRYDSPAPVVNDSIAGGRQPQCPNGGLRVSRVRRRCAHLPRNSVARTARRGPTRCAPGC